MTYELVYENSSIVILARVRLIGSASYLTQASTSSISVKTYTSDGTLIATSTPDESTSVYNTLQTDDRWRKDETGYNVAIPVAGTHYPDGDVNYRTEVTIVPTDGYDLRFAVPVRAKGMFSV